MTIWRKAAKAIADEDALSTNKFRFYFYIGKLKPVFKTRLHLSVALLIMEQIEKDERRASHVYVYKLFWRRNVRNLERRTK